MSVFATCNVNITSIYILSFRSEIKNYLSKFTAVYFFYIQQNSGTDTVIINAVICIANLFLKGDFIPAVLEFISFEENNHDIMS